MKKVLLGALGVVSLLGSLSSVASATATATKNGDTYVKISPTVHTFQSDGPYAVGVYTTTIHVTDSNAVSYATPVDVWYPALRPTAKTRIVATYNVGDWLPSLFKGLLTKDDASRALAARATYIEDAFSAASSVTKAGHTTNAPPTLASGKFPLVLFSHGFAGFRDQSSFLTTRLASWGFVVAAPDHPGRDLTEVVGTLAGASSPTSDGNADVKDLVATINLFASGKGGVAQKITDATHVLAFGHSAGGSAVERLASYESSIHSTTFKGFIGLAGASLGAWSVPTAPYNSVPAVPGVLIAGGRDNIVSATSLRSAYGQLTSSRRYVEITGAGHQAFSDLCQIDPGNGGITALANALGIKLSSLGNLATLATDGCFAPATPVTQDWPIIAQVLVASARSILGFDTASKALSGLQAAYPAQVTYNTTTALP